MSIDKWRARVADLYRPVGREVLPPLQVAHEIEEALVRIREAMIEDLYYRLCRDPARGFQTYFRYAEEAISTNDESLDLLLRAELLGFLAERVPQEERDAWDEIDGLRRADLIADAAVRWIKRYIAEGKNKQALRIAECLGEDGGAADLIASGDDLARAERDVWWALAKVYSGAFEEAGEKLSRIIENLEQVDQDLRTARWAGIMARAYNNRGYLRRVQGRYLGAVSDYEKAVILWRAAEIESELANTLNNLAFAKAEVGLFGTAWRIGQEALRRREEMGPRVPVGLSLNTLAHIAVRDDKPVTARRYAARALRLFRSLEHRRGEGLARVIFSEACRRWAERLNEVEWMLGALKVCYGVEFKRQSGENASVENVATIWNEVVDLLDQEEEGKVQGPHLLLDEPDRQVEALIELGCVYRDLLRFLMQSLHQGDLVPRLAEDLIRGLERKSIGERLLTREEVERNLNEAIERIKQRLVDKGEKALRQAAEIAAAREGIRYRQMEALVNLAWLYYYLDPLQRGEKRVEKILEEAEKVRPGEYVVSRLMESRPKDDQIVFPFLVQSGKAELLRGQIAFNQYWEGERGEGDLKKAVERYLLSLAYDAMLFPHSFRDMRRGMDRIYERLSQLQHRDLHRVWEWTKEFEQQYSLKNWVLDERTGEKGSRFRRFLLDSFGPPERLYEIVER
ncbi:MAG TPA: tetratricopeptide repeat protein [Anaerolineales bacterium]|nr:tetratricopeptide repeat protein [Anaerolineales bacterium]